MMTSVPVSTISKTWYAALTSCRSLERRWEAPGAIAVTVVSERDRLHPDLAMQVPIDLSAGA